MIGGDCDDSTRRMLMEAATALPQASVGPGGQRSRRMRNPGVCVVCIVANIASNRTR